MKVYVLSILTIGWRNNTRFGWQGTGGGLLCFVSHSFPRSLCLSSLVALVTGTIRKAQNLLKQYSQQCLDGKKGASNLIPMEGNHSSLTLGSVLGTSLSSVFKASVSL